MNNIKLFLVVILACILTVSPTFAGGDQDKSGKTRVRILTRYSNPDNVREKYFMDKVAQFQAENPDIDLQDISISDENSRDVKFKTSVSSSDPIEVFNFLGYAANLEYVKNGITPMAFGAKDNYRGGHFLTALAMKRFGQSLKDELVSETTMWNDADLVGLINYIISLYEMGTFGKNNLAYTADGELARLESEKVAMIFSGSWNISTINKFEESDNIVSKGFPYLEKYPEHKDKWMGGPDDFISISSKPGDSDYEATVRVLKFFTSQSYWEGLYKAQAGAGTYPVVFDKTIESDHLTTEFNQYYNKASDMIGEIEQYDTMPSLMDLVRTELQTIFTNDSAQDIADRIQGSVNSWR